MRSSRTCGLLKQLRLDRLSDIGQLQHRLAADEAFLDQLHLFQPLDELLRQPLVTHEPTAADFSLPPKKCDRSQRFFLRPREIT